MRWSSLILFVAGSAPVYGSYAVHPVALPKLNTDNFGEMGILGSYDGISRVEYGGQQNFTSFSAASVVDTGTNRPHVIAQVNSTVLISLTQLAQTQQPGAISQCQLDNDLYVSDGLGLWTVDIAEGTVNSISTGLNGSIHTLFCDPDTNTVYVGGDMAGGVAAWDSQNQRFDTPSFGGFRNGSVSGIAKFGDSLVFAGSFHGIVNDKGTNHTHQRNVTDITDLDLTGLASNSSSLQLLSGLTGSNSSQTLQEIAKKVNQTINAPQQISFQSAQIEAEGTGEGDPKAIACPGSQWALTDNRQGTWRANFPYFFTPETVVVDNLPGADGTETFRFLAFPLNGIMNLTYVEDGETKHCDAFCPLPQGASRQFSFVNSIGMNSFQLDLLSHYGSHAGLAGVQMFHAERFTFAANTLNEGNGCAVNTTQATNSTADGEFDSPALPGGMQATYLSSLISSQEQLDSTQVSFSPNASYSGNYTVRLFTPGCIQDNSCAQRGGVEVSVQSSPDDTNTMTLFQTNNDDKYDTIFSGPINVTSGFHPTVLLKPSAQGPIPRSFVADRLQFTMTSVSNLTQIFGDSYLNYTLLGGKNGSRIVNVSEVVEIRNIFEYSPSNFSQTNQTVGNTTLNRLGSQLQGNLDFIEGYGDSVYLGGDFVTPVGSNLLRVDNGTNLFPNSTDANKTNTDPVTLLSTVDGKIVLGTSKGLFHVEGDALEQISGISSGVESLVSYTFNDTKNVWAATGANSSSQFFNSSTWEQLDLPVSAYLSAGASGDAVTVYLGMLSMSQVQANGAVYLDSDLNLVPVQKTTNGTTNSKRHLLRRQSGGNSSSVTPSFTTGHYINESTLVLGGSELSILQDGVEVGPKTSIGKPANITTLASSNSSNVLFIGGSFLSDLGDSQVTNIAFYDLDKNDYSSLQPPGLTGGNVTRLEYRASSSTLIAAGSFNMAGSLMCSAFCLYDLSAARWNSPANSISGVVNYLEFLSNDVVLLGGNVSFDGQTASVAQYDFGTGAFTSIMDGNKTDFEAVQIVMTNDDLTNVYVVGKGTSGQTLMHWNGTQWGEVSIPGLDSSSYISSLQLLQTGGKKKRDEGSNNAVTLDSDQLLMISGNIKTDQGNFSSVLFDGKSVQPFLVTQSEDGQGSINGFFSQSSTSYSPIHKKKKMRRGFVVLVALAVAVGVMFLIVGLGIIATCVRRRNSGYMLAPGRVNEAEMTQSVPPQTLFEDLHGYHNNQKF